MLTANELRKIAFRTGAKDIGNVEIDVILTHLLQLFFEKGLFDHLAFKGGTMLRKMVFGPQGRLSTDLDFTRCSQIDADELMLQILDALEEPYRGLDFRFDREKDWYLTDVACAANPVCSHSDNEHGVKIKLQVSIRETPILPVKAMPQLSQDYFKQIDFQPAEIPCLALEEIIAEKIRAASQRSKIRDLHDLSEIAESALNQELIRSLAVLKLWNSDGPGLDYQTFQERIQDGADYDLSDLESLLRKDQRPDLKTMIDRVVNRYRFLADLTELEQTLANDPHSRRHKEAEELTAQVKQEHRDEPDPVTPGGPN